MFEVPSVIDKWASDFVKRLVRDYGPHHASHRGETASLQIEWPSEDCENAAYWRLHFEDRFLSRTAHDIHALLVRTMTSSQARASDRAKAALLYHRGIERGWWDGTPGHVEQARVLAASLVARPKRKRASMPKTRSITRDPELQSLFAVLRAGDVMRGKLADPNIDDSRRINAVTAFFDAMEDAGRGDVLKAAFQSLGLKKETANGSQG